MAKSCLHTVYHQDNDSLARARLFGVQKFSNFGSTLTGSLFCGKHKSQNLWRFPPASPPPTYIAFDHLHPMQKCSRRYCIHQIGLLFIYRIYSPPNSPYSPYSSRLQEWRRATLIAIQSQPPPNWELFGNGQRFIRASCLLLESTEVLHNLPQCGGDRKYKFSPFTLKTMALVVVDGRWKVGAGRGQWACGRVGVSSHRVKCFRVIKLCAKWILKT